MNTYMPEEGISSLTDGDPPCGCWDLNSDPLKEQPVLLTAEPSLQPSDKRFSEDKGLGESDGES